MNKITSITTHQTGEGTRMSITYSVINDNGDIEKSNIRINKIVVNDELQSHINAINESALSILE